MDKKKQSSFSFEEAYERLETILEQLSNEKVNLDQAIKLYEEADKLILNCNQLLNDAEQKIEILIKNRSGELALDENGKPTSQPFASQTPSSVS
ncbi:MAG: exodeoxyribonuclease VII small subunit [Chlamydiae bacterium]|nr:exodeoxyribonuclease VII small subunit [Chlamydiota bacterium]